MSKQLDPIVVIAIIALLCLAWGILLSMWQDEDRLACERLGGQRVMTGRYSSGCLKDNRFICPSCGEIK